MYTVAVYLQRFWCSVIEMYVGELRLLPDYFGQSRFSLPSPEAHFGEAGLRALARLFSERTGYEWLSTYASIMSLFLQQLSLERAHLERRPG